jgi:hypothetical protein
MKTLCVIPCGSKKIWDLDPGAGPTQAKDVCVGTFASKCRAYAEEFYPGNWVMLSAKYGFLRPDEIIPRWYNVSFNDPKTRPVTVEMLICMVEEKGLGDYERIVALGGKNASELVRQVFIDKEVIVPLSDCKGIGYMMGVLSEAIKAKREIY